MPNFSARAVTMYLYLDVLCHGITYMILWNYIWKRTFSSYLPGINTAISAMTVWTDMAQRTDVVLSGDWLSVAQETHLPFTIYTTTTTQSL